MAVVMIFITPSLSVQLTLEKGNLNILWPQ
jgi:hypothetical protein